MKKAVFAFLLMPLFAYGSATIPKDPKTVKDCYQNLALASSKDDVLTAIACLKNNPFAGEVTVKEFQQSQEKLLAKFQQPSVDADVTAALAGLAAQKAKRLYISFQSRGQDREVFVVERFSAGDIPSKFFDINAVPVDFIHTSAIFGKDKRVPLQDVKRFSYQAHRTVEGIGLFTTLLTDNRQIVDDGYQGHYPLKMIDRADASNWFAVDVLFGTSYQISPPSKKQDDRIAIAQKNLDGSTITFLSEDEAKQRISQIEERIKAEEIAREKENRIAAEKAKQENRITAEKRARTLAELAKAQRGAEDSCKRTDLGRYVVRYDPDSVEINCQFGGVVELGDLKSAGWLVINKSKDKDGVVTDYYIRKAR